MEASGDVGFGLSLTSIRNKTNLLAEVVAQSLATSACETTGLEAECRDKPAALRLKNVSICLILVAGAIGVSLPLLGRKRRLLPTDGCVFATAKAFAAGVILATGFVHMLPDAEDALGDSCLPPVPWSKFPFSGFVAMVAALMTLVADFVGTQFYERKNAEQEAAEVASGGVVSASEGAIVVVTVAEKEEADFQQMEGEANGMPTHHLESHDHDHFHGHHVSGDGTHSLEQKLIVHAHNHDHDDDDDGLDSHDRHVVVSQVLELGIVSHSVIIGLSLGVSQSPCTIRPLMAALSFHQFFERFALGGCISQAELKTLSSVIMACFFAITTPMGMSIGIGLSSFYNPNSPRALVVEGIPDSISAGILIYMALVDLIAADFLSKKMRSNTRLQMLSYIALFSGASLMSMLAIWA